MPTLEDVRCELKAMRDCGMRVPQKAFKLIEERAEEVKEYLASMKVSDVADFVIDMAEIEH